MTKKNANELIERYTANAREVESTPGCWRTLVVDVLDNGTKIGEYTRNYCSMYNTFLPFNQGDKHYALVSPHYTGTSVLSLPDCKVIAEEPRCSFGFCPTGFYVPYFDKRFNESNQSFQIVGPNGDFGFVSGCQWGDDSSWKIQFLDLSRINDGVIARDDRFGYIELMSKLEDAIDVEWFTASERDANEITLSIACKKTFRLDGKTE